MAAGARKETVKVAPDAVRVWRGFRLSHLSQAEFFKKLGSFFIPGTVQIQLPVGLTAYLPSVLPKDKPSEAPDEIALVFYEVKQAYDDAKKTVGGRAYSDLHGLAFDLNRSMSGFPDPYKGTLVEDEKYHLFNEPVDWQHGVVKTFVGVRERGNSFHEEVANWLTGVQQNEGPDGAIVSASRNFVVYWEHWSDAKMAKSSRMSELREWLKPVYEKIIEPFELPQRLWDEYVGVEVSGGESFNFQFERGRRT
ncbi:MAG: hypothetical protein JSU63_10740 [Phycisphaerales bacterium]|nr:MAG: hypothetical protein JSU63_10740 [Phycisphaerales bacterium]